MSEPSLPTSNPPRVTPAVPRRVVLAAVVMLLLGVVGGLVWVWLADPAQWQVTSRGIVMSESESQGQFGVIVVFVAIGAVVSLGWGWVTGRRLEELGWVLTPFVVVVTVLAALLAWRIGVELGPPDPATVARPSVGDRIPAQLKIDGIVPFLVWPIFGLIGLVGAVWSTRREPDPATYA
ncbi:hypothetical protein GEV29_14625 [Aeromicrobium sp. SMF47]|uniref:Uncharacterized protein n=1 Tax=Aeromicrobium yanjiei TaxID=2662028 RepID=A0A5Q2MHF9_9ACTN|nr:MULTISPECIES: hypothetical protein [Aeromicrobium]MRJ77776.1 hypothetical protein [Aeromicrobium yanjiei]MRK02145.1 hypothetical protein [Aeromicrobium sp. S22]QGG41133.1 hypothetical protein GEV26_07000 [Aeromicrobium yanjiei]